MNIISALFLLGLLANAPAAQAQYNFLDPFQSGLDRVVRGLDYLGDKASEIIGPGLGLDEDKKSAFTATRAGESQYPVGPELLVTLENEFGQIHVSTWPERVVKIQTEIFVGGQNQEVADKILAAIEIHVDQKDSTLDVRTFLPDTRSETGLDSIEVHYTLLIPNNAAFTCKNFFGDTSIREVGGPLLLDAQYGQVDLAEIGGPVKLRMLGEFPLKVNGLKQGGVFNLSGAQADFGDLQGECTINNFRGLVNLHDLTQSVQVDVNCDSGIIQMIVPTGAEPDLVATSVYGSVEATYPMTRIVTGAKTLAYSRNAEATQHIRLNSSFGEIHVDAVGASGQANEGPAPDTQAFNDTQSQSFGFPEGLTLEINAAIGDIYVEGADTDTMQVSATRLVWVKTATEAPPALESLQLEVQPLTDRFAVRTIVTGDMQTLDCKTYRIDLHITCPRTTPLEIFGENGFTSVKGMGGNIRINQSIGDVVLSHNKGIQTISNQKGSVSISQCGGDTDASTRYGNLSITEVYGKVTANCSQGDTIVETIKNDMTIRNNGGNVRILALEGLAGALDVLVVKGDLRMLMPEQPDAELSVTAKNGVVKSRIQLSGIISQDTQEFQSVQGDGKYKVVLAAHDGNVILD